MDPERSSYEPGDSVKLSSRLSRAPRGPDLTSQHHLAERFVRSAVGRTERYGQHAAEVKSAVRSRQRAAAQHRGRLPNLVRVRACGNVAPLAELKTLGKSGRPIQ